MRAPMMTVWSRGSPKYPAASAVMCEIAMNNLLRHAAIVGSEPAIKSTLDRK